MAKVYISWHKLDQPIRGGVIQAEGGFIASEVLDITSGAAVSGSAPALADYATIWSDSTFYYRRSANGAAAATNSTSVPYPASTPVQEMRVIPGTTQISAILLT